MFNNGYNNFYPYQNVGYKSGLFSSLKGKFNWGSLLNNTQKTLNIINQAIPVMYQIKPIWNNTKTVFRIMGAIKDDDTTKDKRTVQSSNTNFRQEQANSNYNINHSSDNNTPNFFL